MIAEDRPTILARPLVTVPQLGAIVAFLSILGLVISGARAVQKHLDAVEAMCNRTAQLETILLKYYPAETQSIFYPGSRTCP